MLIKFCFEFFMSTCFEHAMTHRISRKERQQIADENVKKCKKFLIFYFGIQFLFGTTKIDF